MKFVALLALAGLFGCATSSGIVNLGTEFSISEHDAGPVASLTSVKTTAYTKAAAFCAQTGRTLRVLRSNDIPRAFAQFPNTEVFFICE